MTRPEERDLADAPDELADLPPAAKLLYLILDDDGSQSVRGLAAASTLPESTVRDALDRLVDAGLARSRPTTGPGPRRVYTIQEEPTDP